MEVLSFLLAATVLVVCLTFAIAGLGAPEPSDVLERGAFDAGKLELGYIRGQSTRWSAQIIRWL